MKYALIALTVFMGTQFAQAATLSCTVVDGRDGEFQVLEQQIDVSVDSAKPETFVRSYDVAKTAVGAISVSVNNLGKKLLIVAVGENKEDQSYAAGGSFAGASLEVRNRLVAEKNLGISCKID